MWSIASRRLGTSHAALAALISLSVSGNNNLNSQRGSSNNNNSQCESNNARERAKILRKRTTLEQAAPAPDRVSVGPRRINTREELSKLRLIEQEMLSRWQRDEDGWRELPARAWPAFQPNAEQLKLIRERIQQNRCRTTSSLKKDDDPHNDDICSKLLFNAATSMVFYQLDPKAGYQQYKELAEQGHIDSMVALGVLLLEGMGIPPNEEEGIRWLKRAVELGSIQGYYELGTVLYCGIDGVLDEDPEGAFVLFEKAAKASHTAALYMMADCLVEGEGTEKDIAKAVPLFYQAAERGHRYARQRIRELLARKEYQIPL